MLNLTKKEDASRDLKPNRIKKYGEHLETLILTITETMNQFSLDFNKETLFNIGSGKAASKEATSFLLHVTDIRKRACEGFIEECKNNPGRFEERIKRQKIHSFAKEGANFKLTTKNKIMEVKMERDLFGSILRLALQQKIDMGEMLKFPLTPVPLRLADIDGSRKIYNYITKQRITRKL